MHRSVPTMIVDPVALFREGLRRILNEGIFQPVWCSDCPPVGPIATLSGQTSPLLIIGTEIHEAIIQIAEIKRHYPFARVVLLSDAISHDQLVMALRNGADTVVLRSSSCEALIGTLNLVLDGASVFPAELLDSILEPHKGSGERAYVGESEGTCPAPSCGSALEAFGLSPRELSVLHLLLEGLANKEIARDLGITEATVKVHVKAILRKARVRNRTQVAMWAYRLGLGGSAAQRALTAA